MGNKLHHFFDMHMEIYASELTPKDRDAFLRGYLSWHNEVYQPHQVANEIIDMYNLALLLGKDLSQELFYISHLNVGIAQLDRLKKYLLPFIATNCNVHLQLHIESDSLYLSVLDSSDEETDQLYARYLSQPLMVIPPTAKYLESIGKE